MTTVFGGRQSVGTPVVTYTIIAICVVIFAIQWFSTSITNQYAFAPFLGWTEPWRFVTAMFLHSPRSLMHIGFNMYALYILGTYLEPLMGGLFGALIVLNRHLNRSVAGIYGIVAINAALGFIIPNIAWQAHLGGFVAGLAGAGMLVLARRGRKQLVWPGLAGLFVLVVAVAVAKYLMVPEPIRELTIFRLGG